jgi:hypothetical protein
VNGWLHLAAYIAGIWLLVNTVMVAMVFWNSRLDEKEVKRLRAELETFDSALFLRNVGEDV